MKKDKYNNITLGTFMELTPICKNNAIKGMTMNERKSLADECACTFYALENNHRSKIMTYETLDRFNKAYFALTGWNLF